MIELFNRILNVANNSTTSRYIKYAGGLFVASLLSLPVTLGIAGTIKSTQPLIADIIAISVSGGLFVLSLGLATVAAYHYGGYISSLAISLSVPLAILVLYVVAMMMNQLVTDVQFSIIIASLLGGAVFFGTLAFIIGTTFRILLPPKSTV